jgi:starch phosphorylase
MAVNIKNLLSSVADTLFSKDSADAIEITRTGLDKETIKKDFVDHLVFLQGKFPELATQQDYYLALAYVVRDRLLQRWISTTTVYTKNRSRTVAYLSAEYLLGPHLENNLINLGIRSVVREAIEELGLDFDELVMQEEEPGLGNGGLGRLAACFIDSMATLEMTNIGYGIRYEFGIFDQVIENGWQVERTDKWLRYGNPWEIRRPEWRVIVPYGGHTETYTDENNKEKTRWIPGHIVIGIPYDTPILGYRNHTANTLRLWSAEAPESFDFEVFNRGDYYGAVDQKVKSENLTKVLYPNDEQLRGRELRLEQQLFFTSCALQDMIRIMGTQKIPLEKFHEKFVVQLNDTHPAIAIAELMRLLVDVEDFDWDAAWSITEKTFAYTNHTLLPEALETWPVDMLARILPRHLEIIFKINNRFLKKIRKQGVSEHAIKHLSLIEEEGERSVRMANLACVGSMSINGVAELHSKLLRKDVLHEFYSLWPEKFNNKTNGVTPRRWLVLCNPQLQGLINQAIGRDWVTEFDELRKLEDHMEDASFREKWQKTKRDNKVTFAHRVKAQTGLIIDPDSMFDVQVKRIHEYKRQHLNVLNIISLYLTIKDNPNIDLVPRTFIFGGKAAPGYHFAKLIIKMINSVADLVNNDEQVNRYLKVVFLPNYNVSNGQWVYPAADLSEQISLAGKEASGTGNMKFAINGAITIGTLDGANIEIREEVGEENFVLFGLTAREVKEMCASGYHPTSYYEKSEHLRRVIDEIKKGTFVGKDDRYLFQPIVDNLLYHDPFLVLADFDAYREAQHRVNGLYKNTEKWTSMSIYNTARSGKFSSDRTIREYASDIWDLQPVPIELLSASEIAVDLG